MTKTYKIFVLFGLLGILLIFLVFAYQNDNKSKTNTEHKEINNAEKTTIQPEIIKVDETIAVFLREDSKEKMLRKNEEVLVISKSLQPTFVVKKNKEILDLKIYFDESEEDLLSSRFSNADIYKNDKEEVKFKFPYTLNSEKHSLKIDYKFEGEEIFEEYNFILVFYDDFSVSLNESKFWGMTEEAKTCYDNWKIENGKLITNKLIFNKDENCKKSSLFFIRKLKGDFFVQYDLISRSETVVLNSYLLERKLNFFFGNGTNEGVVLKTNKVLAKKDYIFEQDKTYQIRITRTKNVYKVFVAGGEKISNDNLLISYVDNSYTNRPFNSSGFTVYGNSGNMEIDNFYSSNEDINNIFNFDEE
ncbi:hypothetical protein KAT63_05395 [Candidatus Parcubacteria bacterium]|nr:hypothetical protein [Candidatus Parcubacteria bacterium]